MYVNDRDQINYHGFLKALREMQGVNLKQVAEGICSDSEVSRTEIGDRLPEKLMRDRITSRLGVSGEEYEEYLRPEEYRQWEIRMFILDNINKGDVEAVQRGIDVFDQIPDKNPVQEQFVDAMHFMLAAMKGASEEVLRAYAELAVVHTIPDIDAAFCGAHLLADQELNLIAEHTRLREYYGNPEDEFEWRFLEYEKILNYVDKSYMDTIGKSKIYPKTTYFMCKWVLAHDENHTYLERALEVCNKSIELLRDASRLYYFVELLECRKEVIEHLSNVMDDAGRKEELKAMYDKDTEWETLFKELYAEYDVPVYMSNFTYLYVETECNSAVEVIRTRRNMLKLSRIKVSDNICTEKTVERFENYTHSPSIVVVRDIFDRIGLCAEYKRARVVTDNAEMLRKSGDLNIYLNDFEHEKMLEIINELKENLHMDIAYNQQVIQRNENLIEYRSGRISEDELGKCSMGTLECTLPVEAVVRSGNKYFTREEIEVLFDIAFDAEGVLKNRSIELLQEYCEKIYEVVEPARMCVYELVMSKLASYLGNVGMYDESNRIGEKVLKECLSHRRVDSLPDNLYNKLWNYQMEADSNSDKTKARRILQQCYLLCEIIRKTNWMDFFQNKICSL